MEQFFDIARELVNNGFGIWGIVMFVQMRRLKKAEIARDTISIYKDIAESSNQTLEKLSERNQKQDAKIILLEEKISKFLSVITRMEECRHYAACPARPVVQDYKRKHFHATVRQSKLEQKGIRYPRDNPVEPGGTGDPDGQPP